MGPGGSGYSVDIGAISGTPGFSVVLVDESGRIAFWNGVAAGLFGVTATQAVGQLVADVAGQPRTVTGLGREDFAQVIAEEGGWSGSLVYQRRDGSEVLLQATALRVPLEGGTGTLWLSHLPGRDSDQYALGEALATAAAERRRLMLIAEAGKLFGSTLDLEMILDRVVTQAAEALGDFCLVQLLDESGTLLLPGVTHHNDSDRARVFHDMVTHPRRAAEGVSGRALQSGEPILIARYEPAQSGRLSDPHIAQGSLQAGIHSMIVAPLITRSTRLGVLVAIRDVTEEPYDDTDLQLCADLAERGAQAIYNARLMADVKRADAERAAAADRLRHAERMESLGQLVGGIAHDFNNLLNVIAGFSDLLAEEIAGLAVEDARLGSVLGDVEQVRGGAQRAIRLTRQLLIFARKDVVQPEVLSLNEVIAGLEHLLRRTLGEHIDLNIAPAEGLWPVKADAGQLEQVLVNLAVNARDAMPGGGKLTIDTANITVDEAYAEGRPGLKPGRYARLRVCDTGTGMPPEVAARVFEPFFTTKPQGKGTGLGLATFYGIITGAGGYAQIYSEPGLGTTVTGLLPASGEGRAKPAGPPAATPRGRGETILLVEDEASLQELASRILTRNGYEVRAARTAADALSITADGGQPVDLLLTDVVMPEMLGNEVARRAHAIRPALPVLYMSGYAQPILDTHGAFTSQIDLVEKPFSEATLLTRVRRAIDNGNQSATPPM
jgi:signal transduction histidine kinase/ActR/RegA family two-component response regulator